MAPANPGNGTSEFGYVRERYRDLTTNLGGPIRRDRLWFFTGYQYLRDYDSQPGTDPAYPRTYEQNKVFTKLTWKLGTNWQLMQSLHYERWVNPDRPTATAPFEVTTRPQASVPAITFGHLTHTVSANTLWDVRVGRFVYSQENPPSTGDPTTANHVDQSTSVMSGAPPQFGGLTLIRTNAKATLNHYVAGLVGRRPPVEDRRPGRTGRTPRAVGHSDRRPVHRQSGPIPPSLARSLRTTAACSSRPRHS